MSDNLVSDSCPTYAAVDTKKKKKRVAQIDNGNSADMALYAVVDKKKKEKVLIHEVHKNDERIYSNVESENTGSLAKKEEEPQPTYSVLQRDKTSDVVLNIPSSRSNCFGDVMSKHSIFEGIVFKICLVVIIITVSFLVLAFVVSAGVSYTMISKLRSEINTAHSRPLQDVSNKELMSSMLLKLENLENKLSTNTMSIYQILMNASSIFSILSDLSSENVYLRDFINKNSSNLLELLKQLNETTTMKYILLTEYINLITLGAGHYEFSPAPSCRAIHILQPSSTSGYYWVRSANGASIRVYCEMTKSCGNITGGLTRVAVLNNETRPLLCIGDFVTANHNTRCVQTTENPGCSHIIFPLMNITYSHMCGTVESYWFGDPDGFSGRPSSTTINDNYVDGISLTYGNISNRNHIWTFIADQGQSCPGEVPEYVGNSYSCLIRDKLCPSNTNPCSHMFFTQLQQPVTENIEMRLCRDNHRTDTPSREGIFVGDLDIYVW